MLRRILVTLVPRSVVHTDFSEQIKDEDYLERSEQVGDKIYLKLDYTGFYKQEIERFSVVLQKEKH